MAALIPLTQPLQADAQPQAELLSELASQPLAARTALSRTESALNKGRLMGAQRLNLLQNLATHKSNRQLQRLASSLKTVGNSPSSTVQRENPPGSAGASASAASGSAQPPNQLQLQPPPPQTITPQQLQAAQQTPLPNLRINGATPPEVDRPSSSAGGSNSGSQASSSDGGSSVSTGLTTHANFYNAPGVTPPATNPSTTFDVTASIPLRNLYRGRTFGPIHLLPDDLHLDITASQDAMIGGSLTSLSAAAILPLVRYTLRANGQDIMRLTASAGAGADITGPVRGSGPAIPQLQGGVSAEVPVGGATINLNLGVSANVGSNGGSVRIDSAEATFGAGVSF
jgi:hypothetical protein